MVMGGNWNAAFVKHPPPAHYNESFLPYSGSIVRFPVRDLRGLRKHRPYLLEAYAVSDAIGGKLYATVT
jgi:hypothetical protein